MAALAIDKSSAPLGVVTTLLGWVSRRTDTLLPAWPGLCSSCGCEAKHCTCYASDDLDDDPDEEEDADLDDEDEETLDEELDDEDDEEDEELDDDEEEEEEFEEEEAEVGG